MRITGSDLTGNACVDQNTGKFPSQPTRNVSSNQLFSLGSLYGEADSSELCFEKTQGDDDQEQDAVKFFNSRTDLRDQLPSTVRQRYVIQNG